MGSAARSPPGASAARQRIRWEKTAPVAVKIKLKRLGKIRAPYYRIVVADARTKRDGRAIEEIGKYHPKAEPSFIEVNSERAQHWLSVGAQPTDPARKILEITGDRQKVRGPPGPEGTLETAAPTGGSRRGVGERRLTCSKRRLSTWSEASWNSRTMSGWTAAGCEGAGCWRSACTQRIWARSSAVADGPPGRCGP